MFIFCLLPNEGDSNKQVKISVKFKKKCYDANKSDLYESRRWRKKRKMRRGDVEEKKVEVMEGKSR